MKKLLVITAAVATATTLAALGSATAAGASSDVTVYLLPCFFGAGTTTVPAGSTVAGQLGWAERTRGRVQSFLESQTTTASVDGVPLAQAGDLWSAPFYDPAASSDYPWLSTWAGELGTLASPGDSLTITMQVALAHHIPAGKDPSTGKTFFDGPDDQFPPGTSCTITAV
jgi:hypothetical protein